MPVDKKKKPSKSTVGKLFEQGFAKGQGDKNYKSPYKAKGTTKSSTQTTKSKTPAKPKSSFKGTGGGSFGGGGAGGSWGPNDKAKAKKPTQKVVIPVVIDKPKKKVVTPVKKKTPVKKDQTPLVPGVFIDGRNPRISVDNLKTKSAGNVETGVKTPDIQKSNPIVSTPATKAKVKNLKSQIRDAKKENRKENRTNKKVDRLQKRLDKLTSK